MRSKSKQQKERSSDKRAAEILRKNGFASRDLSDAILAVFQSKPGFLKSIWEGWEVCAAEEQSKRVFAVLLSNLPGESEDKIMLIPAGKLNQVCRDFCVTESGKQAILSMLDTPIDSWYLPPTIAIWCDGKPDGNFVCEAVCIFKEVPLAIFRKGGF